MYLVRSRDGSGLDMSKKEELPLLDVRLVMVARDGYGGAMNRGKVNDQRKVAEEMIKACGTWKMKLFKNTKKAIAVPEDLQCISHLIKKV